MGLHLMHGSLRACCSTNAPTIFWKTWKQVFVSVQMSAVNLCNPCMRCAICGNDTPFQHIWTPRLGLLNLRSIFYQPMAFSIWGKETNKKLGQINVQATGMRLQTHCNRGCRKSNDVDGCSTTKLPPNTITRQISKACLEAMTFPSSTQESNRFPRGSSQLRKVVARQIETQVEHWIPLQLTKPSVWPRSKDTTWVLIENHESRKLKGW